MKKLKCNHPRRFMNALILKKTSDFNCLFIKKNLILIIKFFLLKLDPCLLSPRELTPSSSATATPAVTPTHGFESMETTPNKSGPPTPQLGSPTLSRQKSDLFKRKMHRYPSMTELKVSTQLVIGFRFTRSRLVPLHGLH